MRGAAAPGDVRNIRQAMPARDLIDLKSHEDF